jgi:hypothetical protein
MTFGPISGQISLVSKIENQIVDNIEARYDDLPIAQF